MVCGEPCMCITHTPRSTRPAAIAGSPERPRDVVDDLDARLQRGFGHGGFQVSIDGGTFVRWRSSCSTGSTRRSSSAVSTGVE